jgi:hypothetical protein
VNYLENKTGNIYSCGVYTIMEAFLPILHNSLRLCWKRKVKGKVHPITGYKGPEGERYNKKKKKKK